MKKYFLWIIVFLFGAINAQGTPLRLDYSVTDIGSGLFDYEFELVLDNNDSSWVSGQGWNWIVFGDRRNVSSFLTDFEIDTNDFPIGPFINITHYMISGGSHNGPTLYNPSTDNWTPDYWIPSSVGASLSWSGTSTADLNRLLFSTLNVSNGAVWANFETANRASGAPVPEPATMFLLGAGLIGLAGFGRKRFKRN